MIYKTPYTCIGGKYRPYLEVLFQNKKDNKTNPKTFAMLDSGADHTIIPYSIGTAIGLEKPSEKEVLSNVSGIAGNLSYIERKCRIYIVNTAYNVINGFDEVVWWIYPDKEIENERKLMVKEYLNHLKLKNQCITGTDLDKHFEKKMNETLNTMNAISDRLETSVLLGRPFFNNFEYLQFLHKDREKEEKCCFNYKISKHKEVETIDLKPASDRKKQDLKLEKLKQKVKILKTQGSA